MPASTTGGNANRVFFVEDGTTRGGAGLINFGVQHVGGSGQNTSPYIPEGATAVVYSRW